MQDHFPLSIIYAGSNYAFVHGEITRYVLCGTIFDYAQGVC